VWQARLVSFNSYYCILVITGDANPAGLVAFNSYYCIPKRRSCAPWCRARRTFNSYYCIPAVRSNRHGACPRHLSILTIVFMYCSFGTWGVAVLTLSILTIVFARCSRMTYTMSTMLATSFNSYYCILCLSSSLLQVCSGALFQFLLLYSA